MSGSLQINTPQALVQCQNTTILWTGGVAPYYVGYIASGAISVSDPSMPAVTFTTDERSRNWQCNVAAGVEISLSVRDSNGQMVYSSPVTVQNSTDLTCLPGYVPPDSSSSELSGGAIGGIVGGVLGGLLVLGVVLTILWREKRRRKNVQGYSYREKESMDIGEEGKGEPKVEPYVGRGEVDLGPGEDDLIDGEPESSRIATDTATTSDRRTGDLERETKQMLGVTPNTDRSAVSPTTTIPTKTSGPSRPTPTEPTNRNILTSNNPSSPSDPSPVSPSDASPVFREQEVEYVRHTDGGMVQVELPPLYQDVPRRE